MVYIMEKHRSVIVEEEFIRHLHPGLLYLDYNSITTHIIIVTGATFTFSLICLASSLVFSFFQVYRDLSRYQQNFWDVTITRSFYGVYGSVIGWWALFTDNNHHRNLVDGTTATGSFTMCVTTGFFFFESLSLTWADFRAGKISRLLHVHHWLCVLGALITISTRTGYSIPTIALPLEMSTPFSALCWILLKMGKGNSLIWKINQVILVHTFHLRSVVECYVWYMVFIRDWALVQATMTWLTFVQSMVILCTFTFVVTPYWGYKKTQQLFRPVDWNFEPARHNAPAVANGHAMKVE